MADGAKPAGDILTKEKAERFLESDVINESTQTPAFDLERSTPLGTLKNMIRLHHTSNTSKDKNVVLAQILKIEEGFQPLYVIAEGQDTENKTQLVRFRVLSDRRHYWIPEPKSSEDAERISLHPLAKHDMPIGETASPLQVGDLVDVQIKDNQGQYSSYLDTAIILGRSGHMNSLGNFIQGRRCTNMTLPPLPKDSNVDNIAKDPCLTIGTNGEYNLPDAKKESDLRNKKLVFPRYPLDAPYKVNSQWGKMRNLAHYSRPQPHLGTDYECSIGDALKAPLDGEVVKAQRYAGYGNIILLKHTKYALGPTSAPVVFYTLFAHLGTDNDDPGPTPGERGIFVKKGQRVKRGQTIGFGGNSGVKTKRPGRDGSHLHFEYLVDSSGIKTADQMLNKGNKRKVSKDPETEFFRRGFFEQPANKPKPLSSPVGVPQDA